MSAPDDPDQIKATSSDDAEARATASPPEAPSATETQPEAASPTKAKTKKKRKKPQPELASTPAQARVPLDAAGRERPEFLLSFPEDPELEPLIAAFEAGNYARVRKAGTHVAENHENPSVRAAARELLERIEPDPLLKFLLGVAFLLFVLVVGYVYYSHG